MCFLVGSLVLQWDTEMMLWGTQQPYLLFLSRPQSPEKMALLPHWGNDPSRVRAQSCTSSWHWAVASPNSKHHQPFTSCDTIRGQCYRVFHWAVFICALSCIFIFISLPFLMEGFSMKCSSLTPLFPFCSRSFCWLNQPMQPKPRCRSQHHTSSH